VRDMTFGDNFRGSGLPAQEGARRDPVLVEAPSRLSVLVVDDEPLIRWSLKKGLTRRGHDVVEAESAANALEAIGLQPGGFDVVILDYKLPDRQDLSLLSDVRQRLPKATVVMMTAYGDEEMRAGSNALGARAVIDKPFQVNQIISLIEAGTH
jgi:DNA-binding NtrC family response regulator